MTPEKRLQEAHGMREVRTTMEPHKVIQVSEQEYTDLSRQGLVAGVVRESSEATEPPESADEANARTRREREESGSDMEPTGTGDPAEIKKERKR